MTWGRSRAARRAAAVEHPAGLRVEVAEAHGDVVVARVQAALQLGVADRRRDRVGVGIAVAGDVDAREGRRVRDSTPDGVLRPRCARGLRRQRLDAGRRPDRRLPAAGGDHVVAGRRRGPPGSRSSRRPHERVDATVAAGGRRRGHAHASALIAPSRSGGRRACRSRSARRSARSAPGPRARGRTRPGAPAGRPTAPAGQPQRDPALAPGAPACRSFSSAKAQRALGSTWHSSSRRAHTSAVSCVPGRRVIRSFSATVRFAPARPRSTREPARRRARSSTRMPAAPKLRAQPLRPAVRPQPDHSVGAVGAPERGRHRALRQRRQGARTVPVGARVPADRDPARDGGQRHRGGHDRSKDRGHAGVGGGRGGTGPCRGEDAERGEHARQAIPRLFARP